MGLTRDELSDGAWEKLAPHLAGKVGDVGRTAGDNRLFLNAVLWVMRHGGTWRVLPERFGKHDTVRKRALRWAQKGTWPRLFAAVACRRWKRCCSTPPLSGRISGPVDS